MIFVRKNEKVIVKTISSYILVTNERSERCSYYQSYMGRLDDIQTALKPLKKSENIDINFYDHFGTS